MTSRPPQRDYQRAGVAFLQARKRAILADDMGLGKTRQAIEAARGRVLIVSPKMLRATWDEELAKWWHEDLKFTQWSSYSGVSAREGAKATGRPRESLLLNGAYDTIILDEAHHIKNRTAKQTKAVEALCAKADRVYMLTGTPVPNWAYEAFVLVRLLHPGDERFRSWYRWLATWFKQVRMPWGGNKIVGLKDGATWDEFIRGNDLDTLMLRRTREQVLPELPPLTEQTIRVEMSAEQQRVYDELKTQYVSLVDGKEIIAWSDGGLHTKLRKVCTGLELEGVRPKEPSPKAVALRAIIDQHPAPVIVFAHFRAAAALAAEEAKDAGRRVGLIHGGIEQSARETIVKDLQDGRLDVLVGTVDTLAEGLTLTAADLCVFLEHSWRPSRNDQAKRRIHRLGQQRPVQVVHLVTADSVDERMQVVLASKTDQQVRLLDAHAFAALL